MSTGALTGARVFDGQMHLFFTLVTVLPASLEAFDYVAERIARAVMAPASP